VIEMPIQTCAHCGNAENFEKQVSSWKCQKCGGQNPKVNPILTAVIFLILMYLFLQFMFWLLGV